MLPLPCRPSHTLSLALAPPLLVSLEPAPSLCSPKVVARSEIDRTKVQLISGGGSGHEPSHSGWVGKGMLTAAGDFAFFAHPPISPIGRTPLFPYLTFYSFFFHTHPATATKSTPNPSPHTPTPPNHALSTAL